MLLFRGDVAHAGIDFDVDNTILHVYLDSPVKGFTRMFMPDGTSSTFLFDGYTSHPTPPT